MSANSRNILYIVKLHDSYILWAGRTYTVFNQISVVANIEKYCDDSRFLLEESKAIAFKIYSKRLWVCPDICCLPNLYTHPFLQNAYRGKCIKTTKNIMIDSDCVLNGFDFFVVKKNQAMLLFDTQRVCNCRFFVTINGLHRDIDVI